MGFRDPRKILFVHTLVRLITQSFHKVFKQNLYEYFPYVCSTSILNVVKSCFYTLWVDFYTHNIHIVLVWKLWEDLTGFDLLLMKNILLLLVYVGLCFLCLG